MLGARSLIWMAGLLLVGAGFSAAECTEFKGGLLIPPRPAPDFTLTAADGRPFRLQDQRGAVIALSFGYTFCPDVCPTTLAELVQVKKRLGEPGKKLRIVFITVDPERDTLERLREYTKAFSHGFAALTGPPERLAQVRKAYGVVAEKRVVPGTAATYLVDHRVDEEIEHRRATFLPLRTFVRSTDE